MTSNTRKVATKAQAMRAAETLGLELDEAVSGVIDGVGTVTFDHPTHSFGGDCYSITVSGDRPMGELWAEAIERMLAECGYMRPCTDPACDYHHEHDDLAAYAKHKGDV